MLKEMFMFGAVVPDQLSSVTSADFYLACMHSTPPPKIKARGGGLPAVQMFGGVCGAGQAESYFCLLHNFVQVRGWLANPSGRNWHCASCGIKEDLAPLLSILPECR